MPSSLDYNSSLKFSICQDKFGFVLDLSLLSFADICFTLSSSLGNNPPEEFLDPNRSNNLLEWVYLVIKPLLNLVEQLKILLIKQFQILHRDSPTQDQFQLSVQLRFQLLLMSEPSFKPSQFNLFALSVNFDRLRLCYDVVVPLIKRKQSLLVKSLLFCVVDL